LVRHVDLEAFRPVLVEALGYGDRPKGGRPPFNPVMMFRVLVLASTHIPGDERMEILIRDRLSWLRFLDLAVNEPTPDQRTIRLFREGFAVNVKGITRLTSQNHHLVTR